MSVEHAASLLISVILLGAAGHAVAQSLVEDWVPFGQVRSWFWSHGFPAPSQVIGPFDPNDPDDVARLRSTGHPMWRYRIGYLWTCPFCAGFYPSAAFGLAFLRWPVGTIMVAVPFDVWAVQRWLAAKTK